MFIISKTNKARKLIPFALIQLFSLYKPQIRRYTPIDDYQITGLLGSGASSRVYQGYHVIIKLFKNIIEQDKIFKQYYVNKMLVECRDVTPMLDIIRDEACGGYGLIFQNLFGIPLNYVKYPLDFVTGLKYMKNILNAIQFCHGQGIIHRDLKKSNILITPNGAKLFDFGLAKLQKHDELKTRRFGTKRYFTPEMIFGMTHYSRKVDIWVCGLIMAEVLSQTQTLMPYSSDDTTRRQIVHFSGYREQIVKNKVLQGLPRMDYRKLLEGKYHDRQMLHAVADVIEKMLRIDPEERPEASEVLDCPIFSQIV